jgi:hypothetical protein
MGRRRPRVPAVPPELRRRIPAESSPVRERWMHGGGGDGSRVDEDFFFVCAGSVGGKIRKERWFPATNGKHLSFFYYSNQP